MKNPAVRQARILYPLAGLALSASVLLLSGCGEEDPTAAAVHDASRTLRTFSAEGGQAGPAPAYAQVVSDLASVNSGGDVAQAAAAILLAEAQHGTASQPTAELVEAHVKFRRILSEATNAFEARLQAHAMARAAVAYDPTDDIDRLNAEAQGYKQEASSLQDERAALATRLKGLSDRYTELESKAETLRREAANIELSLAGRTATEAASRAPEIRDLTRQADLLQKDALGLRAQAEMLQPEIDEADALIAQRNQQSELALDAVKTAQDRQRKAQEDAIAARSEAEQAEQKVAELIGQARAVLESEITEAGETALSSLSKSVSSAGKGSNKIRTTARMTRAGAQGSVGTINQILGEAQLGWAAFLDRVASAEPAFGNASTLASQAQAAEQAAQEYMGAAAEAYEAAAEDLSGGGARDIDRETTASAAKKLNTLAQAVRQRAGIASSSQNTGTDSGMDSGGDSDMEGSE